MSIRSENELEVERYELHEPLTCLVKPDRRSFVQAAGSGLMLVVAAGGAEPTYGQRGRTARRDELLNERFHLGEDGTVTVFTGKVEVGQGSRTQLTQAAAEELHLPVDRVRLVMADTQLCPDDGGTAGSRTTPSTVPRVRLAAASLRELLAQHAAERLGVTRSELTIQDGQFTSPGNQSVTLGELVADQSLRDKLSQRTVDDSIQLAPPEDWQVLGTPAKKITSREVVTGAAVYPSDIVRTGMLYGKVLRPVAYGAKLLSVDTEAASGLEATVVHEDDFVGCVAPTSFAAEQALSAIADTARWDTPQHVDSDQLFEYLKRTAQDRTGEDGTETSYSTTVKTFEAAYTVAYIQHAPMEPRAAVAEWDTKGLTVWTGTQQPERVRSELARAFRVEENTVRVIVPDTGGGFGGKHTGEVAVEAARLAKAVSRPVKLRWTREEEFTWAYFRPAGVIEVKAGLDEMGRLTSWDFTNYNSGGSAIETPYRVNRPSTRYVRTDSPLRQGSYRALASTANTFARESAMDELAKLAGVDPLEFRLQHLDEGRLKDVLLSATRRFEWGRRQAQLSDKRGIGLACGTEKGSYVAACAEVEIADGELRVLHLCQVYECGAIQNPDNLLSQVQGAIIQGLGGALLEAIEFSQGRVRTNNFSSYYVPRMQHVPELDIQLLDRQDLPSVGGGETPIIAVAPAIANALDRASGIRSRSMPVKLHG
jgi:isoquinoline 1-oxidoreductase